MYIHPHDYSSDFIRTSSTGNGDAAEGGKGSKVKKGKAIKPRASGGKGSRGGGKGRGAKKAKATKKKGRL